MTNEAILYQKSVRTLEINTDNLKLRELIVIHIKNNLDTSEYQEKESTTLLEDLKLLVDEFKRVSLYKNNVIICNRARKDIFIDYLMGLPSFCTFEFEYYRIRETLEHEFKINGIDKLEDLEATALYYLLIKKELNTLLVVNRLETIK